MSKIHSCPPSLLDLSEQIEPLVKLPADKNESQVPKWGASAFPSWSISQLIVIQIQFCRHSVKAETKETFHW